MLFMKIIVIGDSNVGKTALLYKFTQDKTIKHHDMTIGVDFGSKIIKVDENEIKLQIWDTAGQERFASITQSYCRNAMGIVIVYDITSKVSFDNIGKHLSTASLQNPDVTIMLVGNKKDLVEQRQVDPDEGKRCASVNKCLFIETSIVTNENVNECFHTLAQQIFVKYPEHLKTIESVTLHNEVKTTRHSTCARCTL